ncbi:hypothetical protein [Erwinia endophytica]|nr:hypothetical protein [Erwinia endophytica]
MTAKAGIKGLIPDGHSLSASVQVRLNDRYYDVTFFAVKNSQEAFSTAGG